MEFSPFMLIRVAFITNLVYFMLLFKSNPRCEEIFFHILERTHCAIYKCFFFLPSHHTHTQIKCWIHRQKEIVPDPCRWLVCILNVMFYYPYHCPTLKIFMSGRKIRFLSSNIQLAAYMLLTCSGRYCPGSLYKIYLIFRATSFYWLEIYFTLIFQSFHNFIS